MSILGASDINVADGDKSFLQIEANENLRFILQTAS